MTTTTAAKVVLHRDPANPARRTTEDGYVVIRRHDDFYDDWKVIEPGGRWSCVSYLREVRAVIAELRRS